MEHDLLVGALDAEGVECWTGYEAMNNYSLFQPQKSRLAVPNAFPEYFDFQNMRLPAAERACEHEAVWLDENVFRAGQKGVDDSYAACANCVVPKPETVEQAEQLLTRLERFWFLAATLPCSERGMHSPLRR